MPYDELITGFLAHADAVAHDYQDFDFWAYESLETLIGQDPETAWLIVNKIIQSVYDDEVLEYVSASILEDLIYEHSNILIDRIETLARADTHFKKALSHVWGWSSIPSDIRARLDILVEDQFRHDHSQ